MDFGKPLKPEASAASKSGVRYIPVEQALAQFSTTAGPDKNNNDNNDNAEIAKAFQELDRMNMVAANIAAKRMLAGPAAPVDCKDMTLFDSALYQDRCLPPQDVIRPGDLVVSLISFADLNFVYAKQDAIFSNRNGHFHHNDFLGKPFGCKIRSRDKQGYGFCYLLKPTPELWVRSLPHRTQIVHELDQSQIVFQLQLRPNMTVVESGTGSAAMSHALLRTIAPYGHLHTYELSQHRAETARQEFERHGLAHLVTVRHVDVCGTAGFIGVEGQSVDAVFLDLPEPWNAIPHAAFVLKPNARLANYSPCIEQTQRAVAALEDAGFHSITTMEYRLQEYHVDVNVEFKPPPMHAKRPCLIDSNFKPEYLVKQNGNNNGNDLGEAMGVPLPPPSKKVKTEGNDVTEGEDEKIQVTATALNDDEKVVSRTMTVARPFGLMRGHTAFLTFATTGLVPQSKPGTDTAPGTSAPPTATAENDKAPKVDT